MAKLTKRDLAKIIRLQEQIEALRHKYECDTDNDVILPENSVGSNLDCASASLDCIIQYYI